MNTVPSISLITLTAHDLALIHLDLGNLTTAESFFEQSIGLSSRAGDLRHVGWSHFQLGILSYERGDFPVAEARFRESERIASTVGDVNHLAFVDHELGLLLFLQGKLKAAAKRFLSALRTDRHTGSEAFSGMDYQHLGVALLEVGRWRCAERFLSRAQEIYERTGDRETLSELRSYFAQLYLLQGRLDDATDAATRAVEEASQHGLPQFRRRAAFVRSLCRVVAGRARSESLLGEIDDAVRAEQLPLILDEVYLTFKKGWGSVLLRERPELVSRVRGIFKNLGNTRRLARISPS